VLQAVDPPREFARAIAEIEDGGFASLWMTDSSLHARNAYVYLALAATKSRTLRLGTAVTHPYTRHPAVNLSAIAAIDELSGGRAIYGIGAGDRPVTELGFRPARVQVVREMVEVTRRLLAGETLTRQGPAFRFDNAELRYGRRADLPIYLAASGPKMLRLTGEIADGGLILAGLFPESVHFVSGMVAEGASDAGRDTCAVDLVFMLYGSVGPDRRQAVEESRTMAAWFCQTAPHYLSMAKFDPDLVRKVQAAYAGGEFHHAREAAQLCPDEMVEMFTLGGTPDDAVARITQLTALGVRAFNFFPIGSDRWQAIRLFMECVMPKFRQGPPEFGDIPSGGASG
jgi:5,10-methylenetetrahydromethanopterin reductase